MGQLICFQSLSIHNFLKRLFPCKPFYLSAILFCVCSQMKAQTINWNFDGGTGTDMPFLTTAHVSTSALTQQNNYGTTDLITNVSSSSGYTEMLPEIIMPAAATVSSTFDAASSTYFEFTLTPEQGYSFGLTNISFWLEIYWHRTAILFNKKFT